MGILSFLTNNNTNPMKVFNWHRFNITDFFDIVLSEGDNQAKLLPDGNIPLISAGSTDNGICKYIAHGDGVSKIFPSNIITVDMFGKAFYQPHDFFAVSHGRVNILIPHTRKYEFELDKYLGLFLVTMIEERLAQNYTYGEMCNSTSLNKETIYIPVKNNNYPDFSGMRNYVKDLYIQASNHIL